MKITFNEEKKRAEALDGENLVGECDVVMLKKFWIVTHTRVDSACGGQGIAGKLLDEVVREARDRGVGIKPFCSYAEKQFLKREDYGKLQDHSVITVYGMPSCPDCSFLEDQIAGKPDFHFVDIGAHVKNMKAFLQLRDSSLVFQDVRGAGVGIPCFVTEDGTVTLRPEDVGLVSRPDEE